MKLEGDAWNRILSYHHFGEHLHTYVADADAVSKDLVI